MVNAALHRGAGPRGVMVNRALTLPRHAEGMDLFFRALAGLLVTLGLVGLVAYAARRWGPRGLFAMRAPGAERRLQVVESLALDAQRRLVLVRLDRQERLILLGEGRVIVDVSASAPLATAQAPR